MRDILMILSGAAAAALARLFYDALRSEEKPETFEKEAPDLSDRERVQLENLMNYDGSAGGRRRMPDEH